MSKVRRLIAIVAMSCVGLAACDSQHSSPPNSSGSSSTKQPTAAGATALQSTPTTTPTCVGLSICQPPPPDAEGIPLATTPTAGEPVNRAPGSRCGTSTSRRTCRSPTRSRR